MPSMFCVFQMVNRWRQQARIATSESLMSILEQRCLPKMEAMKSGNVIVIKAEISLCVPTCV